MSRGGESAGKRRLIVQRNERKAAKSERRQQRRVEDGPRTADQDEIMSRFHRLNELRATGAISEDAFELQRHGIFVALGLEDP